MSARIFFFIVFLTVTRSTTIGQWQQQPVLGGKIYDIAAIRTSFFFVGDGGIFRSTNNGYSWKRVLSLSTTCITAIDTTLYAGTSDGSVMESIDGGKSWVISKTGASLSVLTLTAN